MSARLSGFSLCILARASRAVVIFFLFAYHAWSQELFRLPADQQQNEQARFKVTGIAHIGDRAIVCMHDIISNRAEWLDVGEYFAGYSVKKIDLKSAVITRKSGGDEITLFLTGLNIPPDAKYPEKFSKEWANSDANPMYYNPAPLPLRIASQWPNLADKDKEELIEQYRLHGWKLLYANTVSGSTNFAWENIYQEERLAAIANAKSDFDKSLTLEQRAIMDAIRKHPAPLNINSPPRPLTADEMAADRVRREEWAKLRATLTPTQKQIHEAILDSKKAMKRKQ